MRYLLLLLIAAGAFAQTETTTLAGAVTDTSGGMAEMSSTIRSTPAM